MKQTEDLPIVHFPSADAWEAWLAEHHATAPGLWLKLAKKGSGVDSASYADAVDVALCYGWIDGLRHPLDEVFWLQRFTPRKPRSRWSRINRERATVLIASGRMMSAGLHQVELAQQDGRWEQAYASQSTMAVPEDLQRELDGNPRARETFARLSAAQRYSFLYRIQDAKRPETRARRIQEAVALLNEGKALR
jgi:uncharacterized protein YdeI (YjbR/CyaY-like superfamily)